MLSDIFLWVYRLSWFEAVVLVLAATLCFVLLRETFSRALWWKPALALLLAVFVGVVLRETVLGREPGSSDGVYLIPLHSYRQMLAGSSRELLRSNFMNVLLFCPAGLLGASVLPEGWGPVRRVLTVTAVLVVFSTGIEYLQFAYALGRAEIDDVIHNGLGALAGSLLAVLTRLRP